MRWAGAVQYGQSGGPPSTGGADRAGEGAKERYLPPIFRWDEPH